VSSPRRDPPVLWASGPVSVAGRGMFVDRPAIVSSFVSAVVSGFVSGRGAAGSMGSSGSRRARQRTLSTSAKALPDNIASKVDYLIVFSRVPAASLAGADRTRADHRAAGYRIADTSVRRYQVHQDAVALARPISAIGGGRHSQARAGEDVRRLAREIATLLSLDVTLPGLPEIPPAHDPRRS
jgi:hypothetical protein